MSLNPVPNQKMVLADSLFTSFNVRSQNNENYKQFTYTELVTDDVIKNTKIGYFLSGLSGTNTGTFLTSKGTIPIQMSGYSTMYFGATWENTANSTSKVGVFDTKNGIGIGYNNGTFGIFEHYDGVPDSWSITYGSGTTPGNITISTPGVSSVININPANVMTTVFTVPVTRKCGAYNPVYGTNSTVFVNEIETVAGNPTFAPGSTGLTGSVTQVTAATLPSTTWHTDFIFDPTGPNYLQDYAITVGPGGSIVYFGVLSKGSGKYELFYVLRPLQYLSGSFPFKAFVRSTVSSTSNPGLYISSFTGAIGPSALGVTRRIVNTSGLCGTLEIGQTYSGNVYPGISPYNYTIKNVSLTLTPTAAGTQSVAFLLTDSSNSYSRKVYKILSIGNCSRGTNNFGSAFIVVDTNAANINVTPTMTQLFNGLYYMANGSGMVTYTRRNACTDVGIRGGFASPYFNGPESWPYVSYGQGLLIQAYYGNWATALETRITLCIAEVS